MFFLAFVFVAREMVLGLGWFWFRFWFDALVVIEVILYALSCYSCSGSLKFRWSRSGLFSMFSWELSFWGIQFIPGVFSCVLWILVREGSGGWWVDGQDSVEISVCYSNLVFHGDSSLLLGELVKVVRYDLADDEFNEVGVEEDDGDEEYFLLIHADCRL